MKLLKFNAGAVLLIVIVFHTCAKAQSLKRTVISSGGNYSSNTIGGLYANVGELQINTFSTPFNFLTEGFVQPFVQFPVLVPSHSLPSPSVIIFPNPSSDIIYLSVSENKDIEFEIYDIQGKLIMKEESIKLIKDTPYSLSIGELNNGVYFIKIYNNEGMNNTFRFIKM